MNTNASIDMRIAVGNCPHCCKAVFKGHNRKEWFEQHRSECKGIQRVDPVFKNAYIESAASVNCE